MDDPPNDTSETHKKGRVRKKQLYASILQLMEFYFSDANLSKDRFLMQLLQQDPYVDVNIFLQFNKVRKLNCTVEDIRKAVSKSEMLILSENREKVKRKTEVNLKENVDQCTIYVENIPAEANHDSLIQIFSDFGKVVYVSLPKYKHNRANKGFAFIEFDTEADAQNALDYFQNIGCRMPFETEPEKLASIRTFEENEQDEPSEAKQQNNEGKKRKCSKDNENPSKKLKKIQKNDDNEKIESSEDEKQKGAENTENDLNTKNKGEGSEDKQEEGKETEGKKKKKHKKDKRKTHIKELGLQVLSKTEWKKMRNRYLNLQRKKMKELKQYLHKHTYRETRKDIKPNENENEKDTTEEAKTKIEFLPGVIVKVILQEPCVDLKRMKKEMKSTSTDIKFVDVPMSADNSSEIYLRFANSESAKRYVEQQEVEHTDDQTKWTLLEGEEEKAYWQKMKDDKMRFEEKKAGQRKRKQRGRDKLLKRAEKEATKHIFFEGKEQSEEAI